MRLVQAEIIRCNGDVRACGKVVISWVVVKKGIIMAGKYAPLENYLRDLPESQREITLDFE
jgi:hypothetical protein